MLLSNESLFPVSMWRKKKADREREDVGVGGGGGAAVKVLQRIPTDQSSVWLSQSANSNDSSSYTVVGGIYAQAPSPVPDTC